ncbi:MAG: recombinase family protein [Bacteroidia bacterium]|nr:MAG: recombinase family protein [Bacteroidia bacterium]
MKIGYARVSTIEQNLDLQIDALKQYGCETIYEEKVSGKNSSDRPELQSCIKSLRAGDTLVFWRLDRLGRNLKDLVTIVNDLKERGIFIASLTESIDTSSPAGNLIFHLFASLAEFERNIIKERTKAGLDAARARGRKGGRPEKLNEKDKKMIQTLMADKNNSPTEIAKQFRISKAALYRLISD